MAKQTKTKKRATPKAGAKTKSEIVVGMLTRKAGATRAEIIVARKDGGLTFASLLLARGSI